MVSVLIVDDHEVVLEGVERLLKDAPGIEVVAKADSGEEALKLARERSPDVVLMDLKMPGIGGMEATKKLLRQQPDLKVVILTACEEEPFPSRLLQVGASGYISKGSGPQEMIKAIHAVARGQRYLSPGVAQLLALKQYREEEQIPIDKLSERELQILIMIANGTKVQDIADKLCLSPKTVNSHRYRMFEKLSVESDVELTLLALRHGLIDHDTYL